MYERGYLSLSLVQFFILDEADRMLDMGFEPQVRQIVSATDMGSKSRIRRQNMMFSATFAREVQAMARDFLDDYIFITVGRVGSASELVTQKVTYADNLEMKTRALEKVIKEYLTADGLAVVFVETKRGADDLEKKLYDKNVSVTAIHGDRTQSEREEALAAFKSGANPVMVATDVAARGLDISNVSLVVNFDLPKQIDDYVHRIGRTGRAGRKGVAVAFVDERCAYLPELYDLLSEAKQETPLWFEDLCRTARRPAKGKGREERSFGGRDVRELERAQATDGIARQTSRGGATNTLPVARPASGFGNTGQDDAW
jgi:ATP-dependent RNA helicase DDX3X